MCYVGAVFSTMATLESLMLLLAGVVWPHVFTLTLQYNARPGTSYIFMAILGFMVLPLLL